jgi:hypothetical protein
VIGQLLRCSGFYSLRQHHLGDQPGQRLAIKDITTQQVAVKPAGLLVRLGSLLKQRNRRYISAQAAPTWEQLAESKSAIFP